MPDARTPMQVVHTPDELDALRKRFGPLAFVPTMGALHEGHLSLIRRAAESEQSVVVSVFVNPTQFGPDEDFEAYPRTLEADRAAAAEAGASFVFMPAVDVVYPPEYETPVPTLPPVATEPALEDRFRPGHFAGVCQVVARLFDLVRPSIACFGEKDFQQLLVIQAMVDAAVDRWHDLQIVPCRTVREPDGLAMSSRNVYLSPEQRDRALGISRALQAAHAAQRPATAEAIMRETLEAHQLDVQYAAVRDATTLMPVDTFEQPTRALIAAKLGDIRLIDNRAMTVWS